MPFNMHAKPAQTLADDSGGRWDGTDLRPSSEPVECSLSPDLITVLKGRAGPPGESLRSHAQSNFEQTAFLCTWTLLPLFPEKKIFLFYFCILSFTDWFSFNCGVYVCVYTPNCGGWKTALSVTRRSMVHLL